MPYYRDKYFFANPDAPGFWLGSGCALLGLSGTVTQQQHERLFYGYSPEGIPLIRNAGPTNGWYGIDFTENCDKTESILLASMWKKRSHDVTALMVDAARPMIAFVEKHGATLRFGTQGTDRQRPQMVVGAFPQMENRDGECHAHAHLIFYRPAFASDGRSGALDQQSLFQPQLKMAMGALFRVELAYLSEQRFGMTPIRKSFGFAIEGVPQNVVDAMSTRRQAIEARLSEGGFASARAAAFATLATRSAKVHVPLPVLVEEWESQFKALGFGPDQVAQCLNHVPPYRDDIEIRQATVLKRALDRVTEHKSSFTDFDLVRFVAEEAQGKGLSAQMVCQTVDRALEQSPAIVRLGYQEERPLFSTPEIVALEKSLLAEAEVAQRDHSHVVNRQAIDKVLAHYPDLSPQQRDAVCYLTARPGAVQILSGWPGAGKTTLLRAAREVWESEGYSVYGAAHTGKAAVGLAAEAGIQSDTIDMTLIRLRKESESIRQGGRSYLGIDHKSIFVIEEAVTAGTRQLKELQRELLERGAKLNYCGDPRQTQSIEFGGAMAGLARRIGHFELTEIRRQQESWAREAVKDLGEGNAPAALAKYAQRGLLTVANDRTAAMDRLTQDWARQGLRNPEANLILTATRAETQKANHIAQCLRTKRYNRKLWMS
jgi:conjugative relaxase-like TrwC/TraI family protein